MPPEKRMQLSAKNVLNSYKTIFTDHEYTKLVIAIGANFSGFFLYVLASPVFLAKHLGLGPQQYAYLFIPTVTGMILGSYLARHTAGKYAPNKMIKLSYAWMGLMVLINILICYTQPANLIGNILPIALFNIGMATCMPILSLTALNRHAKIRGTAASGQAFMQMLLSTVSAGFVVPFVLVRTIWVSISHADVFHHRFVCDVTDTTMENLDGCFLTLFNWQTRRFTAVLEQSSWLAFLLAKITQSIVLS